MLHKRNFMHTQTLKIRRNIDLNLNFCHARGLNLGILVAEKQWHSNLLCRLFNAQGPPATRDPAHCLTGVGLGALLSRFC